MKKDTFHVAIIDDCRLGQSLTSRQSKVAIKHICVDPFWDKAIETDLRRWYVDLILLDLRLSGNEQMGLKVLHAIMNSTLRQVPVVLLSDAATSSPSPLNRVKAIKLGAKDQCVSAANLDLIKIAEQYCHSGTELSAMQLVSRLRIRFSAALSNSAHGTTFRQQFERPFENYAGIIESIVLNVLEDEDLQNWFQSWGLEVMSWHFNSRRGQNGMEGDESEGGWMTGQWRLGNMRRHISEYENGHQVSFRPFPWERSPYIRYFSSETERISRGIEGPIQILINGPSQDIKAWDPYVMMLSVPYSVATQLATAILDIQDPSLIDEKMYRQIARSLDTRFRQHLSQWMKLVGAQELMHQYEDWQNIARLINCLWVTLRLIYSFDDNPELHFPRYVVLCPAFVDNDEIGGIGFVGHLPKKKSPNEFCAVYSFMLAEVSTTFLAQLRLREDANLQHRAQELAAVDEAKRFMVHRLSHDLRHPVQELQFTMVDMEQKAQEMVEKAMHIVEKAQGTSKVVQRFQAMLDQTILAVSVTDPKEAIIPERDIGQVSEAIADVVFFNRKNAEERNFTLIADQIPEDWEWNVDEAMVTEIIDNLIQNALEHSKGDRISISVDHPDNDEYIIHVCDNGEGIPSAKQATIFESSLLRQTKSSERIELQEGGIRRRIRGNGLAICRLLARALGGDIEFTTALKRGTDFILTIPATTPLNEEEM